MVTLPNHSVFAVLLSDAGVERDSESDSQASTAAATEPSYPTSDSGRRPVKCAHCNSDATVRSGRTNFCELHLRIKQMREVAASRGKFVPDRAQIESIFPADMRCSHCCREMALRVQEGTSKAAVASLQHDADGGIRIICVSCNSRHHNMPGDMFYSAPNDHGYCAQCKNVKPLNEFYSAKGRRKSSYCKECSKARVRRWGRANRDEINERKRKRYHAKEKGVSREMQEKYRGECVDDGDLGSIEDEPREPRSSFYHPYG